MYIYKCINSIVKDKKIRPIPGNGYWLATYGSTQKESLENKKNMKFLEYKSQIFW